MYKIIINIFTLITLFLLFLKSKEHSLSYLIFFPIAIWVFSISYCIKDIKHRVIYASFLLTFYVFLLGKITFIFLERETLINYNLSVESYNHTFKSLFLSLISIFIGYICIKKSKDNNKYSLKKYKKKKIKKIYQMGIVMYMTSAFFRILILIEKINFVKIMGYKSYYSMYSSKIPLASLLASFYYISFYIILSTLPSKKKTYFYMKINLLLAILSLGFGQRNGFILDILVMIIYIIFRSKTEINRKNVWLNKKKILLVTIIFPLLIITLNEIGEKRWNEKIIHKSVIEKIEDFFIKQGNTVEVITQSYQLRNKIPTQNIPYVLGPLRNYITQNVIVRKVFNLKKIRHDRLFLAKHQALFSNTISYMLFPKSYLKGSGTGSSFIAELYCDFGYFGIFIGSFLIGILLKKIENFNVKSLLGFIILLMIARSILYVPRNSFSSIVIEIIYIPNILVGILILFTLKIKEVGLTQKIKLGGFKV